MAPLRHDCAPLVQSRLVQPGAISLVQLKRTSAIGPRPAVASTSCRSASFSLIDSPTNLITWRDRGMAPAMQ